VAGRPREGEICPRQAKKENDNAIAYSRGGGNAAEKVEEIVASGRAGLWGGASNAGKTQGADSSKRGTKDPNVKE